MAKLIGVDFEVFGRVQGVFFRKYTQQKAKELKINGFCMNTKDGTVVGRLEGDIQLVQKMKNWLRAEGSPQSSIERTEFKNEQVITKMNYDEFVIKK